MNVDMASHRKRDSGPTHCTCAPDDGCTDCAPSPEPRVGRESRFAEAVTGAVGPLSRDATNALVRFAMRAADAERAPLLSKLASVESLVNKWERAAHGLDVDTASGFDRAVNIAACGVLYDCCDDLRSALS